jgi:hypothetical protein
MFGNQELAMTMLPGAQANLQCPYFFSGMCGWHNGYSFCPVFTCGHTQACGYGYSCPFTVIHQIQCPGITAIPAQVGPADPVEGLRALRQQLELALAAVEAQERVLLEQRAAAGG